MLVINSPFLNYIEIWTSPELFVRGKRKRPIYVNELMDYLEKDTAACIVTTNKLKDYRSSCKLVERQPFKKIMSRDEFLSIRASLKIHFHYDLDVKVKDPLWQFARNATNMSVPVGVSSLDENKI